MSPRVGVVVPCRNERRHIVPLLDALAAQTRRPDQIVVVDDASDDGTGEVVRAWAAAHPGAAAGVVEGNGRGIAAAVNAGIAILDTDVVVRLDGHCIPSTRYVELGERWCGDGSIGVAGGPWRIEPGRAGRQARAIAVAAAHPFGSGGAAYRSGRDSRPRDVETVPFGCFRRSTWSRLGGLNESLQANEDYEFNLRVRRSGLRVVLDPSMACVYFARPSLAALARQYLRYGRWKAEMLRLAPSSMRTRQVVPALLVPALVAAAVLTAMPRWRALGGAAIAAYAAVLLSAGLHAALTRHCVPLVAHIAAALGVMQVSWSVGFWGGLMARAVKVRSA